MLFCDALISCSVETVERNLELLLWATHDCFQEELDELVSVDTFISVGINLAADPFANEIRHAHILLNFLKRDILLAA